MILTNSLDQVGNLDGYLDPFRTDSVPERIFEKVNFEKESKSAENKSLKNYPA